MDDTAIAEDDETISTDSTDSSLGPHAGEGKKKKIKIKLFLIHAQDLLFCPEHIKGS